MYTEFTDFSEGTCIEMEFSHTVFYLKTESQKKSAEQKVNVFTSVNRDVANWINGLSEKEKKYLSTDGNGQVRKMPILYGKGGTLLFLSLEGFQGFQEPPASTEIHGMVLSKGQQASFKIALSPSKVVPYFDQRLKEVRLHQEKKENTDWTFSETDKWEKWLSDFSRLADLVQDMSVWVKGNRATSLQPLVGFVKNQQQQPFQKHLTVCKETGFELRFKQGGSFVCKGCQTVWKPKGSHVEEWGWELKLPSIDSELNRLELHKQSIEKQAESLKKELASFQKKGKYVPLGQIDEQKKLESMEKGFKNIIKESKEEDFNQGTAQRTLEEINSFFYVVQAMEYKTEQRFCQRYLLSDMKRVLREAKKKKKIPQTEEDYQEMVKKWESTLEKEQKKWDSYLKKITKDIPATFDFAGKLLVAEEVKEILNLLNTLDGKFGYHLVADTLKGSKQKKISEFQLQKKPQYGRLSRFTKEEVLEILRHMTKIQWVTQTSGDYPKIYLTNAGKKECARLNHRQPVKQENRTTDEKEKKQLLAKPFEQFTAALDMDLLQEEAQCLYLKTHYQKEGVLFLKKVCQFYKQTKKQYPVIEGFVKDTYEDKYQPILKFYQKTAKNKAFLELIDKVL